MCTDILPECLLHFVHLVFSLLVLFSVLSDCGFFCFCRTSKVKSKGPKDIMAVEDMNGELLFSTHLPYPNNLSRLRQKYSFISTSQTFLLILAFKYCVCFNRPLVEPTESLLQLLLLWDPAARGGRLDPDTNKPYCYTALQNILSMKVDNKHTCQ